jgi:predicted glycogen debranching enzyme
MIDPKLEWLDTNGLGGFAMGTASGERTRRYHSLLMTDRNQQRSVLVNGIEVWAQTASGTFPLSTQIYDNGYCFPDARSFVTKFDHYPWPQWRYELPDGTKITQEILLPYRKEAAIVRWNLIGSSPVILHVRPLLSVRDYHTLHHENPAFQFGETSHSLNADGCSTVTWKPYGDMPAVVATMRGNFNAQPIWFRNFYYEIEQQRGLDFLEDLASPGEFHVELQSDAPVLLSLSADAVLGNVAGVWNEETLRRRALSPLKLAASQYIACRDGRDTIIAGYPWFTDWGRDTFIALRGLCLAGGEFEVAKKILLAWSETVSEGMLPNRFPDGEQAPEYNSVDASLWFVIASFEWLSLAGEREGLVTDEDEKQLLSAISAILNGYRRGTRHAIRMDRDGLIAAGEPGVQLTWMDAKIGDWVATPRIGKPVEIQALWLNCLYLAGKRGKRWAELFDSALPTFRKRFWNEQAGCLYDVVDVDHAIGKVDASFRPNQILALGGLPFVLIEGRRARSIVDAVEQRLWTPIGLRTLDPNDPRYKGQFQGNIFERDSAYHNGTAWPWLLGPFVDAWIHVRGNSPEAIRDANQRFWSPIEKRMKTAGLGHVTEVASGDALHAPGGCPFQAWSLSEYMRVCKPTITGRS